MTTQSTTTSAPVHRFPPNGLTERIEVEGGVIYHAPDMLTAIAYTGRKAKATWYYKFRNAQEAESKIAEFIGELKRHAEQKAERKAERLALDIRGAIEEGAILVYSWGWEQTNVEAFQVIRVLGKRVAEVREISVDSVPGSRTELSMSDTARPVPDAFIGESRKVSFIPGLEGPIAKLKYGYGYLWDGERSYHRSWYG